MLDNPGSFPSLLGNKSVNRGFPQEGSIVEHEDKLTAYIEKTVENNYNGYAIINVDQWGLTWQQNIGKLYIYKEISRKLVTKNYHGLTAPQIELAAANDFNNAAKRFLKQTILTAKSIRPLAKWGFRGIPICNKPINNGIFCSKGIQDDNNNMIDLFKEYSEFYPSFEFEKFTTNGNVHKESMASCVEECRRNQLVCTPLLYYKYKNINRYLTKQDLETVLTELKNEKIDSVIIWAKETEEFNSEHECEEFHFYVTNVLGPVVQNITK